MTDSMKLMTERKIRPDEVNSLSEVTNDEDLKLIPPIGDDPLSLHYEHSVKEDITGHRSLFPSVSPFISGISVFNFYIT